MHSHTTFNWIELEICMRGQVTNVINRAKFLKIVPKLQGTPKMAFPIHNVHRRYNSVGL